jgi:hypothetical protein
VFENSGRSARRFGLWFKDGGQWILEAASQAHR